MSSIAVTSLHMDRTVYCGLQMYIGYRQVACCDLSKFKIVNEQSLKYINAKVHNLTVPSNRCCIIHRIL